MRNHWLGVAVACLLCSFAWAQDAATGALFGTVSDTSAARIAGARISVTNAATGVTRTTASKDDGSFAVQMLTPGEYIVRVESTGMAPQVRTGIGVSVDAAVHLPFTLAVGAAQESITVTSGAPLVETQPSALSNLLEEDAIAELPVNGGRFTDLALLTPGATTDPRNLTSTSTGDLAFGGINGYHTSFLVDGGDNNNGFFGQARGRYRAPYQFSKEVIQQFRVSSNTYGAELGRSSGAVVNAVTKSGSNRIHGTAFYYLRDSSFNARPAFADDKPSDRQHQFGFTVGGPIRKNQVFYYLGFDQHLLDVPTTVRFLDGSGVVTPRTDRWPKDYDSCVDPTVGGKACDQALVSAAAQQLSSLGGTYRTQLRANAALAKLDWTLSPHHQLTARFNTSRYSGANNVYFDPASPITYYSNTSNGEERVATESATVSLTSALGYRATSQFRLQFSRDVQASSTNSADPLQKIYGVIEGFGRATILPRQTRERRLQLAHTISLDSGRHSWKLGGDALLTWTRNFFPMLYGGEFIFANVKVDQWDLSSSGQLLLSPLRAYAHGVPRYYIQNFGNAVSHPNSNDYSWFVQDTVRLTSRLAMSFGLRYDLQTFRVDGLVSNPLWPQAGKLPRDTNNFAPRIGFAYSVGDERPAVIRGGWGVFYTRIPQIYASSVATHNGLTNSHLFLDYRTDRGLFPAYPSPLVSCAPQAIVCTPPETLAGKLTSEISAFAPDFQTPYVQQASLGVEKEVSRKFSVAVNYLYVHGVHLIRARDVNLPSPVTRSYPVYDDTGSLLGYYDVASFADWQRTDGGRCFDPPCVGEVVRPIPQLGAITQFESAASSVYHGLTISARRRMARGLYFRLAYTWGHAIDSGQDAPAAISTVQNSYAPAERASSIIDQRHRLVLSWITEPRPFHREHPLLASLFNHWKWSGVVTIGSGRPVSARILNDANLDGNWSNDRLPGASRNSLTGPGYATADMRVTRKFQLKDRLLLEVFAEAFNVTNRNNRRVSASGSGFMTTAGEFISYSQVAGGKRYPAYYQRSRGFLQPTSSYAPRQLQLAARLRF